MAKRFTDTDKWKNEWFKNLPGAYKLFWFYIHDDCNHAGIWFPDFEIAQIRIGRENKIDKAEAMSLFSDKIVQIDNGGKWFIPSFIQLQYGELSPQNNAHRSVIKILAENNLKHYINNQNQLFPSPSQGAKDKDQAKDKDKEKDKDNKEIDPIFKEFITLYPGRKRAAKTEFDNFTKKYADWKDILPLLIPAVKTEMAERNKAKQENGFFPEPKNLQTWINNRGWEMYIDDTYSNNPENQQESKTIELTSEMKELLALKINSMIETNDKRRWQKIGIDTFKDPNSSEYLAWQVKDFHIHFKSYKLIGDKNGK